MNLSTDQKAQAESIAQSIEKTLLDSNQRYQVQVSWVYTANEWRIYLVGSHELITKIPDLIEGFIIYKVPVNYV